MIYACLRFIEEWAHPLTLVNFVLIGLSSGSCSPRALAALAGEGACCALARCRRRWLVTTLAAGARALALRRNARDPPPLDAAVGHRHRRGRGWCRRRWACRPARSTRASSSTARRAAALRRMHARVLVVLGFALPALLAALGLAHVQSPLALARRARRAGARPARRPLVLLRAGEAPAEPVLPGRVLNELAARVFGSWIRRVDRASLRADPLAGLLGAVLVLPQAIAFAALAGLPPQYGLATAVAAVHRRRAVRLEPARDVRARPTPTRWRWSRCWRRWRWSAARPTSSSRWRSPCWSA